MNEEDRYLKMIYGKKKKEKEKKKKKKMFGSTALNFAYSSSSGPG